MGAGIAGMKATKVGRNAGHSSAGLGTGVRPWFPAGHDMQKPQPLVGAGASGVSVSSVGSVILIQRELIRYSNHAGIIR